MLTFLDDVGVLNACSEVSWFSCIATWRKHALQVPLQLLCCGLQWGN